MVKHLKFSKIQIVDRRGALMLVSFLDDEGNMYDWAPKWRDVEEVFLKQINVERHNKPESEWLNRFAQTVQEVVEGAQRIESAYKVTGSFELYQHQKLLIHTHTSEGDFEITPGFEITVEFLDNWFERTVEVLVINNVAIRIRTYGHDGEVVEEYPPPEMAPDDLPF